MIHIIDNGQDYSDHALHFVETAVSADDLSALFPHLGSWRKEHIVLGSAVTIAWRPGKGATKRLGDFVAPYHFCDDDRGWPHLSADALAHTSPAIARELLSDWLNVYPPRKDVTTELAKALREKAGA